MSSRVMNKKTEAKLLYEEQASFELTGTSFWAMLKSHIYIYII